MASKKHGKVEVLHTLGGFVARAFFLFFFFSLSLSLSHSLTLVLSSAINKHWKVEVKQTLRGSDAAPTWRRLSHLLYIESSAVHASCRSCRGCKAVLSLFPSLSLPSLSLSLSLPLSRFFFGKQQTREGRSPAYTRRLRGTCFLCVSLFLSLFPSSCFGKQQAQEGPRPTYTRRLCCECFLFFFLSLSLTLSFFPRQATSTRRLRSSKH